MNQIKRIRFELWVDDNSERGIRRSACAFHVDREEGCTGLRYIWFVLSEQELSALGKGTVSSLEDGYHKLSIFDQLHTFFDMDFPREDSGRMEVSYLRLNLPRPFWRYLARIARTTWAGLRRADEECQNERYYYSGRRIEVSIPLETLERFQRRYGRGTGQVEERFSDALRAEMAASPDLTEQVERVIQIARGYTTHCYQTVVASISGKPGDWYFCIFDQKNRRSFNGGIILHSDGYSIHS